NCAIALIVDALAFIPGETCLVSAAAHAVNLFTTIVQLGYDGIHNQLTQNGVVFSLVKIEVDIATVVATCATTGLPVVNAIVENGFFTEVDCREAFIELATSLLQLSLAASHDPNELVGPPGVGVERFLRTVDRLHYGVFFENAATATAAAAHVHLASVIDGNI